MHVTVIVFFLSGQKASKEPILEEAELDFKPLDECEEGLEEEESQAKETKETETEAKREVERKGQSAPQPGSRFKAITASWCVNITQHM